MTLTREKMCKDLAESLMREGEQLYDILVDVRKWDDAKIKTEHYKLMQADPCEGADCEESEIL